MTTERATVAQAEPFDAMEDTPQTEVAVEEEAPSTEEKVAEGEKAPKEDWKAKAEAAEAKAKTAEDQLTRERNNRRSQRIQGAKAMERDQLLLESVANQKLILNALGQLNPDIAEELTKQSVTNQTDGQKRVADERSLDASDELREIGRAVGLNTDDAIRAHPEFKNTMLFFRLGGYEEAIEEARIAQGKIEVDAARAEPRVKRKNVSTETGSGSGGGGLTDQEVINRAADPTRPLTPEDKARLDKILSG